MSCSFWTYAPACAGANCWPLQWDDLDFKTGTLTVNKQVYEVKGQLQVSVPKTRASIRRLILPPGVMEVFAAIPGDGGLPVDVSLAGQRGRAHDTRSGATTAPDYSGAGRVQENQIS